jgi:hypothetical protein
MALPVHAPDDPERPSLINRFVQHPDRVVAASAMALLIAESRRRTSPDAGQLTQTDLPAELHHRLVWWVAAALRERRRRRRRRALDRALSEAANAASRPMTKATGSRRRRCASPRRSTAARRELRMLVEALGDRRIVLFIALLAHALGVIMRSRARSCSMGGRAAVAGAAGARDGRARRHRAGRLRPVRGRSAPRPGKLRRPARRDPSIEPIQARAALTPLRLIPIIARRCWRLRRGDAA